MIVLLIATNS